MRRITCTQDANTHDATYVGYVHALACDNDNGGGHWKMDTRVAEVVESNELWVGPREQVGENEWRNLPAQNDRKLGSFSRNEPKSFVIHENIESSVRKRVCCDLREITPSPTPRPPTTTTTTTKATAATTSARATPAPTPRATDLCESLDCNACLDNSNTCVYCDTADDSLSGIGTRMCIEGSTCFSGKSIACDGSDAEPLPSDAEPLASDEGVPLLHIVLGAIGGVCVLLVLGATCACCDECCDECCCDDDGGGSLPAVSPSTDESDSAAYTPAPCVDRVDGTKADGGGNDSIYSDRFSDIEQGNDGDHYETVSSGGVPNAYVAISTTNGTYSAPPNQQPTKKKTTKTKTKTSAGVGVTHIAMSEVVLDKQIGQGSFGVVFRGQWRGAIVAVKQVKLDGANGGVDKARAEFEQELALTAKLQNHVNVVGFYGITELDQGDLGIIVEYCNKGSLVDALYGKKPRKLALSQQLAIAQGTAAGVAHLHHQGIVHRDLAARNVLLNGKELVPKVW